MCMAMYKYWFVSCTSPIEFRSWCESEPYMTMNVDHHLVRRLETLGLLNRTFDYCRVMCIRHARGRQLRLQRKATCAIRTEIPTGTSERLSAATSWPGAAAADVLIQHASLFARMTVLRGSKHLSGEGELTPPDENSLHVSHCSGPWLLPEAAACRKFYRESSIKNSIPSHSDSAASPTAARAWHGDPQIVDQLSHKVRDRAFRHSFVRPNRIRTRRGPQYILHVNDAHHSEKALLKAPKGHAARHRLMMEKSTRELIYQ